MITKSEETSVKDQNNRTAEQQAVRHHAGETACFLLLVPGDKSISIEFLLRGNLPNTKWYVPSV